MNRLFSFLILITSFIIVTSCTVTKDEQEINVSLKLSGDFNVDVSQEPITKASSNDLYAINVYRAGTNYASGLFDDESTMNITLLSGYKYSFSCCLIKDGKNKLYYGKAFDSTNEGYAFPFQRGNDDTTRPTSIENQFVYNTFFTGIKKGAVHLKGKYPTTSNATYYANIKRYYGETKNYTPVHNGVVEIELKLVTFGVKFEVSGLQEGKLVVTCGNFLSKTYTSNGTKDALIYTFEDPYDCWNWENEHATEGPYSISPTLTLSYINTGERSSYMRAWDKSSSNSITLKRNVMTTVNVNVSPDLSGIINTFSEESLAEDENAIDIEVQGSSLIDISVDTNE